MKIRCPVRRGGWQAAAVALLLAAPAARAASPEVTHDGLRQVPGTRALVYVRPDARLASYGRVLIEPLTVSYRREPPPSRGGQARDRNFPLTPAQVERMNRTFQEVFATILAQPHGLAVAKAPGTDVLRLRAALTDVRVGVPTTPATGARDIYVESLGEATLVGELLDSQSGEVLARFADRQRVGEAAGALYKVTPARSWVEVREQLAQWASQLRDLLVEARGW